MHDTTQCANCGRAIDDGAQKFCPACGQPTPAHRIDWHFLGHELEHSVLHMDRGVLYTLKELMLRPGQLIRDYIEGRRAHHVKPLLLVMMVTALVTLLSYYLTGGDILAASLNDQMQAARKSSDASAEALAAVSQAFTAVAGWVDRHFAVASLLLIPIQALCFRIAFGRMRSLNYPEWLVITMFLTAQALLIWAIGIPLARFWPPSKQLMLVPMIIYNIVSLVQFFRPYPRWKSALRAIGGYALYMIGSQLFLLGVVIVLVIIAGFRAAQGG